MYLSNCKFWYSNNCLHFLKQDVPLDIVGKQWTLLKMFANTNALAYFVIEEVMSIMFYNTDTWWESKFSMSENIFWII